MFPLSIYFSPRKVAEQKMELSVLITPHIIDDTYSDPLDETGDNDE